jgi:hypothetical protein
MALAFKDTFPNTFTVLEFTWDDLITAAECDEEILLISFEVFLLL